MHNIDACNASNRAASRIAVPTSLFSKRLMSKFIDDFNQFFSSFKVMGDAANIPEQLKEAIRLATFDWLKTI